MSDNMDIELLRTLVAIAATGSFGTAAASVHRTQSAVSMQMKRLEDTVGQPLFEKQGRRAVLTAQGQNLLLYARRIVNLQEEALASFRSPEIHGEVRLGVCDDYVMRLMPPILARFAEQYPQVHIRLDSQSSAHLITATAQGDLDFSLVNVIKSDTEYEKLVTDPLVWVTSNKHLVHEQRPLPIAVESACLWGSWARQALDQHGVHYRIAYTTFSFAGISAIVDAGLAISVMSRNSVPDHLRILSDTNGLPELPLTTIGLVRKSATLSPAAQRLIDTVRQQFAAESMAAA